MQQPRPIRNPRDPAEVEQKSKGERICALCLQPSKLVNSHILSDFLFDCMRDEKNRIITLSSDPSVREGLIQSGPKEPMLCSECDNERLGVLENYARSCLEGWKVGIQSHDLGHTLLLKSLDYRALKLFYVSLIWRMSVSVNPFFRHVDLGPYENRARQMLMNRDPGRPEEFAVLCIAPFLYNGKSVGSWMQSPSRLKGVKGTSYMMVISGLYYLMFVNCRDTPDELKSHLLQPDGTWRIARKKADDIPFLGDDLKTFADAINRRSKDKV